MGEGKREREGEVGTHLVAIVVSVRSTVSPAHQSSSFVVVVVVVVGRIDVTVACEGLPLCVASCSSCVVVVVVVVATTVQPVRALEQRVHYSLLALLVAGLLFSPGRGRRAFVSTLRIYVTL